MNQSWACFLFETRSLFRIAEVARVAVALGRSARSSRPGGGCSCARGARNLVYAVGGRPDARPMRAPPLAERGDVADGPSFFSARGAARTVGHAKNSGCTLARSRNDGFHLLAADRVLGGKNSSRTGPGPAIAVTHEGPAEKTIGCHRPRDGAVRTSRRLSDAAPTGLAHRASTPSGGLPVFGRAALCRCRPRSCDSASEHQQRAAEQRRERGSTRLIEITTGRRRSGRTALPATHRPVEVACVDAFEAPSP